MELKLKDLRYLVAVADHRHFGRAAARCFVSQPTLSAQLKKLEQALGVQLIERAPNNVSLTAAGEEIVARARRVLEASDEVVALARSQRDPLAGQLRVALLPTIGPYLLPRRRARLAGLSRHEPRDPAADGGYRCGRDAAAGARRPRRLPQRPRGGAASVRETRAAAAHRRAVAQEHGAAAGDRCAREADHGACVVKNKLQLLVRRAAANILNDYTPPTLGCSEELLAELEAATRFGPPGSEWARFAAELRNTPRP